MPLMGFGSLSTKLGERILAGADIKYESVSKVDFCVDWFNGTDVTPGETDYPVKVTYVADLKIPETRIHTKTYRYMSDVINALEDVEDDLRHS